MPRVQFSIQVSAWRGWESAQWNGAVESLSNVLLTIVTRTFVPATIVTLTFATGTNVGEQDWYSRRWNMS